MVQSFDVVQLNFHGRLEKLAFGTMGGRAKVLGTLIGIGGAMLLTFYKGVQFNMGSTHLDLLHHGSHRAAVASSNSGSAHSLLGALLAFGSCISYALWLNIQVIQFFFKLFVLFILSRTKNDQILSFYLFHI